MSGKTKIAFLGTGLMGAPMARRLLGAGFSVTVWNRDAAKAEPLAADGADIAASPADAVAGAAIVFTMLTNGQPYPRSCSSAASPIAWRKVRSWWIAAP